MCRAEIVLIVSKDHPLAARKCVSFSELRNEKWLMMSSDFIYHDIIISLCKEAGFTPNIASCSASCKHFVYFVFIIPIFLYRASTHLFVTIGIWGKFIAQSGEIHPAGAKPYVSASRMAQRDHRRDITAFCKARKPHGWHWRLPCARWCRQSHCKNSPQDSKGLSVL